MLQHTVAPAGGTSASAARAPSPAGRPTAPESVLIALDLLRQQQVLRRRLVVADVVALTLAWSIVVATAPPGRRLAVVAAAVGVTMAVLTGQRRYRNGAGPAPSRDLRTVAPAVALGFAAAAVAATALDTAEVSITRLAAGGCVALGALVVARSVYGTWLRASRAAGRFPRPVVLIGGNDEAAALDELLRVHPELGYRVLGVVAPPDQLVASLGDAGVPWLGDLDDAVDVVTRTGVGEVVIAGTAVPYRDLQRLARELPAAGVEVQLSAGVRGVAQRRLRWQTLAHEPVLTLTPADGPAWQAAAKRTLDVVVAVVGLVIVSPVLALAALAVKVQDRGPVLYVHERVGRHGRTFRVLKLRTMVPDAERRLSDLRKLNNRDGPLFKLDRDPRVTRVGRLLRQTSIDELPQLVNVLRGEMSVVGPRPALPAEVDNFDEELRSRRLSVRPGITGLWQIEARDNPAFGAYRRLDLFYVDNWSIGLDLMILWTTFGRVLGRGVRALRRSPKAHGVTLIDASPARTGD